MSEAFQYQWLRPPNKRMLIKLILKCVLKDEEKMAEIKDNSTTTQCAWEKRDLWALGVGSWFVVAIYPFGKRKAC